MNTVMQQTLEKQLLEDGSNLYGVYRLTRNERDHWFLGLDELRKEGIEPDKSRYALVYIGEWGEGTKLGDVFFQLNEEHPHDYFCASLSVGDIVVVNQRGSLTAYYVERAGYTRLPDFIKQKPEAAAETFPTSCQLCGQELKNSETLCERCDTLQRLLGGKMSMDLLLQALWEGCFACGAEIVATVNLTKAAELLYPGGMLAVILPETFLGESTKKSEAKQIYAHFNHVVQVSLDADAFAWLGVRNFPTKLLILQRKADSLPDVPYSPELVKEASALTIFRKYVEPVMAAFRKRAPQIQLQINRDARKDDERKRQEAKLLYQIKAHPRTRSEYERCRRLLEQYYTQKCPEDMGYEEWQKTRLHYKPVIEEIRAILRRQNHREEDKVVLVKGKDKLYFKAYSRRMQEEADERNSRMDMQRITQLTASGTREDFEKCGAYRRLMQRKHREYLHQVTPFAEMEEDPGIRQWLENWELTDKWGRDKIKLNARQLYDTNLTLQKRYAYLQWSQGAGKTVSGTAQGMYRLAHGQTDYVFVISSAISIETTWAPFLAKYQIPHKVIKSREDLRKVYPGDFVLMTLGRVKNYKKYIQKIVRLASRKLFLIYDEAQNSSALEASDDVGKLTKATLACFGALRYKLLMSGTSINNNVIESYPQLLLLYNGSANMLCKAEQLYSWSEEYQEYESFENDRYMVISFYCIRLVRHSSGDHLRRRRDLRHRQQLFLFHNGSFFLQNSHHTTRRVSASPHLPSPKPPAKSCRPPRFLLRRPKHPPVCRAPGDLSPAQWQSHFPRSPNPLKHGGSISAGDGPPYRPRHAERTPPLKVSRGW